MKQVLVKHHIGAIMIAVIGLQGLVGVGSIVFTPLLSITLTLWNKVHKGTNAIHAEIPKFTSEVFVWGVLQSVILLFIAFALALWLYSGDEAESEAQPQS